MSKFISPGEHFINGNFASAEAALIAGCRFFAGYPITPSSEVLELMSRRLPQVGGHFIEMEDEIASMAAIVGASSGGLKSMTATSGPGFSLMQENIGLAIITETPVVILNEMRGGPSTGLPTRVGQGDVMQARWGTHGDHESISYAPNSVQEMFELTIEAFNAAEQYRQPVVILADQVVGHMSENLIVKPHEEYTIIDRSVRDESDSYRLVYDYSKDFLSMILPGMGFRANIDSLTHDERGYPSNNPEVEHRMLKHILGKIQNNEDKIVQYEEFMLDDAEIVIVAYGILSRSVHKAVKLGRKEGLKLGLFRPITLWPFPRKQIRKIGAKIKMYVVAEINYGQYAHTVREYSTVPVKELHFTPGAVPMPRVLLKQVKNIIEGEL